MSDVKQQTTREILRATVGYRGNLLLIQFGSLNTEIAFPDGKRDVSSAGVAVESRHSNRKP